MELQVARRLNGLNEAFYQAQAASFSATRQSPWQGWDRCLSQLPDRSPLRVLDVAAGNLRLARHLARVHPDVAVEYLSCDSCPDLLPRWQPPSSWQVSFELRDVVSELLDSAGHPMSGGTWAPSAFDLVACFGFLHHVPTPEARASLLRSLALSLAPGGICCVSLWRFMESPRLARQAREVTPRGLAELGLGPNDLDAGDYLLGWQGRPHTYRYCHSFGMEEIAALAEAVADVASLEDHFVCDGAAGNLNAYVVLRGRG